jgi:hypothetical protein
MVVGAAILFTTAHVTVLATGGYSGSHAYITLAVAAGVAVASILVGRAWGEGRRTLAVGLVIAIAAGEVYALLGTAERLTAAREAGQAPLRQAVEARQKLEAKVAKAEATVASLPETSARFREAIERKAASDAAVVTKSSERGCVANCRLLLQAQADQNQQEVEASRREMAENRTRLEQAVADAKGELAAFKAPPSPSPLADRIGWQAWVLDLVMAGLGSLSANGLACLMMVFGSHRRSENADTTEATETASEVAPAIVLEPLEQQHDGTQAGKVVPFRPAGSPGKRRTKAPRQGSARRHTAGQELHGGTHHPYRRGCSNRRSRPTPGVRELVRGPGDGTQADSGDWRSTSSPVRAGEDPDQPKGRPTSCAGDCPQILIRWKPPEGRFSGKVSGEFPGNLPWKA